MGQKQWNFAPLQPKKHKYLEFKDGVIFGRSNLAFGNDLVTFGTKRNFLVSLNT